MTVNIKKSSACGSVVVPPSKSVLHRLILCAAFAKGKSEIENTVINDDIAATLDCVKKFGARAVLRGTTLELTPAKSPILKQECSFFCGESASTLRFITPLAMLGEKRQLLSGKSGLMKRPMEVYRRLFCGMGLVFEQNGQSIAVRGPLKSGRYRVAGNISSQFISGLLLALINCQGESLIEIEEPIESKSYIELTVDAAQRLGAGARWLSENEILIEKGCQMHGARLYAEGDYSSAAFFAALGALGGDVRLLGLSEDSLQGDKIYEKYFPALVSGSPTLDITDCPDLAPILMAVAAAKNGAVLTGTRRLAIKESDRGQAMRLELEKLGARVICRENEIEIKKAELHAPAVPICGHNDHRIVMAMAVLLSLYGGSIQGAQAVSKSFPDFFEKLRQLKVEVQEIDNQ